MYGESVSYTTCTYIYTHMSFDICICHQNFIPDKTSLLYIVWTQCHELKTTITFFTKRKTPNYVYVTLHLNISLMKLLPGLNKCTSEFAKFLWQKLMLHNIAITKDHLPKFQKFIWDCGGDEGGVLVPEVWFQVKIQWIMLHILAISKDQLANFWEIYIRMWKRQLGMSLPEVRQVKQLANFVHMKSHSAVRSSRLQEWDKW